ncbi:hypothetical protein EDD17DRAFT_1513163 [Pisolithus thermaeus]|nr:hypothetical protein EDD17DRAFT_1513163 [Pisolithus thermaeus]
MSKRPSIPHLESPRVKRPNLESDLKEKWKTMNEIVHLLVQSYRDSSSISGDKLLAITLMQIQVFCPPGTWKKPLGTSDCQKLVEDNPHIVQALEKAIESGHYEEILSLREDCTTDEEEEETDFEPTTTGAAATIAWTTKYNGKCHEVLLKNINSAYRSEARTSATVIQSSGTGKSCTVHELAALVFTIPFNLRHPEDGWAYPPTDRKVWKYLCDVSNVKSVDDPLKTRSLVVTGSNAGKSFVRARSKSTEEHPRYGIRAYGCTEATWKVIRDPEGDTYKRILSTDDILADHPRQDKDSLELVHRMLPFWDDDPLWYTHGEPTESDFTNTDESLESTEEGSEVED